METILKKILNFNLELTYPTGYMTKCTLPKASYSNVEITCILEDPLQDYVDMKHQVIRDGINELFTFTEISSDKKLHWGEETSTEEEEETKQPITIEINSTNEEINRQNIR